MPRKSERTPEERVEAVLALLRREGAGGSAGEAVTNRFVYRALKAAGLLIRKRSRDA
jgi:hypothetical protein